MMISRHCRVTRWGVYTLFGLLSLTQSVLAQDNTSLLKKHVQFLQSRIDHKDALIRTSALDGLAANNLPSQMTRLKAAIHDSSDTVQCVALKHLRGNADQEALAKVKQLVEELARRPFNEVDDQGLAVAESRALGVLVASGDAKARTFAIQRLRSVLGSEHTPWSRWAFMSDAVADNDLKEFLPVLKKAKDERRERAVWAAAKLGDADSIKEIKKEVRSGKESLFAGLAYNPRAREVLGIEPTELQELVRRHTFVEPTDKCILLAYLGDHDGILRELKDIRAGALAEHIQLSLVFAARDVGDERYVKSLDELFESSKDESIRVACSVAVIKIYARARMAPENGK